MYAVKKDAMYEMLNRISAEMDLFVPLRNDDKTDFGLYRQGCTVDFECLKTAKSAKDIFFPQSEELYRVEKKESGYQIDPAELCMRPFAVFGIRACDLKGLQVLDRVFRSEPYDSFYCARRDHGILIGLSCNEPEETCFCSTYGIDAAEPEADINVTIVGETFFFEIKTEAGKELLEKAGDIPETVDDTVCAAEKAKILAVIEQLPYGKTDLSGWGEEALYERFDSPLWDKLYRTCLGCGTCTFVCPTCQCYDIRDFAAGKGTIRYRCWDSCMYSDFTLMAGGNSRKTQRERYRQRFMHKLAYYPANNDGLFGCVGCGRCVRKCPASLHILKVIRAFQEEKK